MSIILRFSRNDSLTFLSLYVESLGRFEAAIPKDDIYIHIDKLTKLANATPWTRKDELTSVIQESLDKKMYEVQTLLLKRSIKYRQENNKISIEFNNDKLDIYVNFGEDF